jgi:hypothetical protein
MEDPVSHELALPDCTDLDLQTVRMHQKKWNFDSLASRIDRAICIQNSIVDKYKILPYNEIRGCFFTCRRRRIYDGLA